MYHHVLTVQEHSQPVFCFAGLIVIKRLMGKEREDYGETMQERRWKQPEEDSHIGRKKKSKGPYVVTSFSFRFIDWPSYFMVMTEEAGKGQMKRAHYSNFGLYGVGEGWTEKEAKLYRRVLEKEYKDARRPTFNIDY